MRGVLGAFRELDAAVSAIEALKEKNVGAIRVYTPTPRHELEEAMGAPPSPVRRFTLSASRWRCGGRRLSLMVSSGSRATSCMKL